MRLKNKKGKIKKKLNLVNKKSFIWFVVVFVFLQVLSTIQTLSLGATLVSIEDMGEDLVRENQMITSEIVKSTSLSELEEDIEGWGFIKPQYNLYVSIDSFVAKAN